ncbi:MAG: IS110 family transposase [Acidobacteria bacterium]|nr:IS110 family transposase [Acidobacteriota bacterium]
MTLYIGVDFHPHQQMISWCDSESGETESLELFHKDMEKVREFYGSLDQRAVVGIEASGRAQWFEDMLDQTDHKLLVGDPYKIRKRAESRHKNDRLDAELIMTLLVRDEFPAIWRRSSKQNRVLEILRLRLSMVNGRTGTYNRLQVLAHTIGLPKGRMRSQFFQAQLKAAEVDEACQLQRSHLFSLMESYNEHISKLDIWLQEKAKADKLVELLMTQKGVGYLTALAVVNTIGDISRFENVPKQVTKFIGYDSLEASSAGKRKFGSISKAGSPLVRWMVGQATQTAVRYDPKLKSFYKRLLRRKHKAVAKTATARKLLVKLSIMLRDNISAEEFDRRGRTVGILEGARGLK